MGNFPSNKAAIAGQPVTMSCGLETNNSLILWYFQPVGSQDVKLIFNGYRISKVRPKYFISASKAGECYLTNGDPSLEDAGTYQCLKMIHNQIAYDKEIGFAELTVLCKSEVA